MSDDAAGLWRALRPLMFQLDPEVAHRLTLRACGVWSRVCRVELPARDVARDPALATEKLGLRFPNPVGLAAGLDKDAEAVEAWQALGFGSIEVGTVTAHPQPGNPTPRLFRLKADRALMNRMGFNNHGAAAMAARLRRLREKDRIRVPLGVNLGKSKITPNEEAASDYRRSFELLGELADYVVVNVSSPNTPGLRDLQQADEVRRILDAVQEKNQALAKPRPVLLKLAPDLADEDAVACARAALDGGCPGLIVANTTISRAGLAGPVPEGSGGISGAPVFERSTALLRHLRETLGPEPVLVGVGGIMDGPGAQAKLDAGADLLQVYTGFIYGGPGFVRRVLADLRQTGNEGR